MGIASGGDIRLLISNCFFCSMMRGMSGVEMIALIDVEGYVEDEVNGLSCECVVEEEESPKLVEGCGLEGVLSSIFVCLRLPQVTL